MKGAPWDLTENSAKKPKTRKKTDMVPAASGKAPGTPSTSALAPENPVTEAAAAPMQAAAAAGAPAAVDASPPAGAMEVEQPQVAQAAGAPGDWQDFANKLELRSRLSLSRKRKQGLQGDLEEPPARRARVAAVGDDDNLGTVSGTMSI